MTAAPKDSDFTLTADAVGIGSSALFACGNCKDEGVYLNFPELKDMPSFCWCKAGRTALRRRRIEYLKNKANDQSLATAGAGHPKP